MDRRHLSICGGFLIHFVMGAAYIAGSIQMYLVSYFRQNNPGLTLQEANNIIPLQTLGSSCTQCLGSWLCIKYGSYVQTIYRPVILGNLIMVLSVFFSSYCKNFWSFVFLYGVVYGVGLGLSVISNQYTSVLQAGWNQFPLQRPKVSGFIIGGFGLGAFVFNIISQQLINPDNARATIQQYKEGTINFYFDQQIASGVPSMLRVLSLIYFAISSIGIVMMGNVKTDKKTQVRSVWSGLKTISFWRLYFGQILAIVSGFYLISSYKNFGEHFIGDDMFLTAVGSVASVCNASFRFAWGYFMYKTSFKTSFGILLALQIILVGSLYYIAGQKWVFSIWICLILICEGGHFVLLPTFHSDLYGPELGAKLFGIFVTALALGSIVVYFTQLLVVQKLGYQIMFWITAAFSGISLINILTFKPSKHLQNPLYTPILEN